MRVLFLYISFIIKCEWKYVNRIWIPLLKMEKMKGYKFLKIDKNGNSDKFLEKEGVL